MKVLGISGWSGCGKTTLIVSLIPRLKAEGLTVSTLKNAHHELDLDTPGKDTHRHREAGVREVLLCTPRRWVLQHELTAEPEPALPQLLARLEPVDIVLLEGWKTGSFPKLEVWRAISADKPPRFPTDPTVIAVAGDPPVDTVQYGCPDLPVFRLDDLDAITAFVLTFIRASESTLWRES
ncbi:MAG: molybdopterin-guanine dinucleotide biosynthesis protein B [Candidatus Competibacteraceae bacterium]